jgi:hypothetical protein
MPPLCTYQTNSVLWLVVVAGLLVAALCFFISQHPARSAPQVHDKFCAVILYRSKLQHDAGLKWVQPSGLVTYLACHLTRTRHCMLCFCCLALICWLPDRACASNCSAVQHVIWQCNVMSLHDLRLDAVLCSAHCLLVNMEMRLVCNSFTNWQF